MALIASFTTAEKQSHNSHKFAFTLTPTNYGYWKTMIHPFLVTNNLFGYIDGTIPCPSTHLPPIAGTSDPKATTDPKTTTDPQANPNYPIWISNDAHIRMLIISTISEASFRHVQGQTSRDLWLALERAYAPHTSSREYTLKTQLLKIQMKGDETPEAYLNRAHEYADALAAIGEPVKDKDLVMLVVSGLRDEYNGLKSTITARQFPTAFDELHALLSDHDYMLGKTRAPAPLISQAFTATTGNSGESIGFSPSSPSGPLQPSTAHHQHLAAQISSLASTLGYQLVPATTTGPQAFHGFRQPNNNNRGHRRRGTSRGNNRGRGDGRQFNCASNQNTVYGTCNRCGIGHLPSQCPNRDPSTIRPRQTANFANSRASSSAASTSWFPDTGANSHVTPDLASMDNSEAYYGSDALHVGNGRVYTHYPAHGPQ